MSRADLYPSRVGGPANLLPRKDPVVHGNAARPLSASERSAYGAHGFIERAGVFEPAETRRLLAHCQAVADARRGDDSPEVIREPGSDEVRSIFAVHRDDPVFAALAADPRIAGIAEQILGSSVYVHQSRINLKPGFSGREFYWHSDFETWHVEDGMPRMRAVSVTLSLTENTEHNGPLMLVPGSHFAYVACPGKTPENHFQSSLRRQEYGVPPEGFIRQLVAAGGIRSHKGPPGSIVAFDCNVLHGSAGNITPLPRTNVFLVFNSVENPLEAPFGGTSPRPDFIASRDFTPLSAG